ncbi:hypothetical protein D3C84_1150470 [compost metagenome]
MTAAREAASTLFRNLIRILSTCFFNLSDIQKVVLNEAVTIPRSLSSGDRPACEVI